MDEGKRSAKRLIAIVSQATHRLATTKNYPVSIQHTDFHGEPLDTPMNCQKLKMPAFLFVNPSIHL
jgi:hypothetical protein